MTELMKFTCTGGPYGDECSSYDVSFPEGWTFEDFLRYMVHTYSKEHKEWGDVSIGSIFSGHVIEYKSGMAWLYAGKRWHNAEEKHECYENSVRLYESNLKKKVVSIYAYGGWSTMDYVVKLEEQL